MKSQWKDGTCQGQCNTHDCNWDGGDCNQLCQCDTDLWLNDKCDENCNTTDCIYDFYDCVDFIRGDVWSSDNNQTCFETSSNSSNYSDSNYNYNMSIIERQICYNAWIDDEWCYANCNNIYCNYDHESVLLHCCSRNCHRCYCSNFSAV